MMWSMLDLLVHLATMPVPAPTPSPVSSAAETVVRVVSEGGGAPWWQTVLQVVVPPVLSAGAALLGVWLTGRVQAQNAERQEEATLARAYAERTADKKLDAYLVWLNPWLRAVNLGMDGYAPAEVSQADELLADKGAGIAIYGSPEVITAMTILRRTRAFRQQNWLKQGVDFDGNSPEFEALLVRMEALLVRMEVDLALAMRRDLVGDSASVSRVDYWSGITGGQGTTDEITTALTTEDLRSLVEGAKVDVRVLPASAQGTPCPPPLDGAANTGALSDSMEGVEPANDGGAHVVDVERDGGGAVGQGDEEVGAASGAGAGGVQLGAQREVGGGDGDDGAQGCVEQLPVG